MKLSQRKITFLIFSALCVFSFAFFSVAQENQSSDKNIFLDSDQDGLSDEEEKTYGTDPNNRDTDGDGYSDGAEVKSGYDPLKPAPGDKIITNIKTNSTTSDQSITDNSQQNKNDNNKENLTQKLSEELANLINQKAGEKADISIEDLNLISQKLTSEKITFEDLPEVDTSEIKIKKQKYSKLSDEERKAKEKEDALEYLTALSYIFANNIPQKISESKDLENFSENIISQVENFSNSMDNIYYFSDFAERGENILKQLKEIEVPESLLEYHIVGMKLAKYAILLKNEVKPFSEDPIAGIASLSKIQNLIFLALDFSEKINSKFSELGISEIPVNL